MPKGIFERKKIPPIKRFMAKVKKLDNGCWFWTAYKDKLGYGRFLRATGKNMLAHRWSYLNLKGIIKEGLELDHLCRNPSCVNPDHLEAVSHQENMRRGITGQYMKERSKLITHCPQGHEYNQENTYYHRGKYKQCRICKRDYLRKYRKRKIY